MRTSELAQRHHADGYHFSSHNLQSVSSLADLNFQRPRVHGKFLYVGNKKFFIKGTTYGAFPPNREGYQFPERPEVAKDFALMREGGINTILTYTIPPLSLLD